MIGFGAAAVMNWLSPSTPRIHNMYVNVRTAPSSRKFMIWPTNIITILSVVETLVYSMVQMNECMGEMRRDEMDRIANIERVPCRYKSSL
jgi:hypothetical protein